MQVAMQFSLISLFANVLPMASLLLLGVNFVRLSAIKNEFHYKKRSMPDLAFGIGPFMGIFEFISFFAILINIMIGY